MHWIQLTQANTGATIHVNMDRWSCLWCPIAEGRSEFDAPSARTPCRRRAAGRRRASFRVQEDHAEVMKRTANARVR